MQHSTFVLTLIVIAVATPTQSHALAGDCMYCGCHNDCRQICRLICEDKKVEVTCWGFQCEDFCVAGPSTPGCPHCEAVCSAAEKKSDSATAVTAPQKFVWTEWIPGCAKVFTRKKLMKRLVTKTIPSYKWVLEEVCPQCEEHCTSTDVATGMKVPPVPVENAKVIQPVGTKALSSRTRNISHHAVDAAENGL